MTTEDIKRLIENSENSKLTKKAIGTTKVYLRLR